MASGRQEKLISEQVLQQAGKMLRVLAHPQRLRMVELLLKEPYSVGELAEKVELPPAAVSQHLNHMAAHGIVEGERVDRQVHYRVVNQNACFLIDCLRKHG